MKKTIWLVILLFLILIFRLGENKDLELKTKIMEETKYETEIVYSSDYSRPEVLIIAGIHGNEVAGIYAVEELIYRDYLKNTVYIPRANIRAVEENKRTTHYMLDLNRVFPGGQETDTHRLAGEIFDFIEEISPSIIIDIHEWENYKGENENYYFHGIILNEFDIDLFNILEAIKEEYEKYNENERIELIVGSKDGTINKSVNEKLGKSIVTLESSMELGLEKRINFHIYVIEKLLKGIGVDVIG